MRKNQSSHFQAKIKHLHCTPRFSRGFPKDKLYLVPEISFERPLIYFPNQNSIFARETSWFENLDPNGIPVPCFGLQNCLGPKKIDQMKATVFCAVSLDGFIAREDGDVSWLTDPPPGKDGGFSLLMQSIDYLVMGRRTFEKVLEFGVWPYTKPVLVLTRRQLEIPDSLAEKVETMSGEPSHVVATLAARGAKHLYVDGGDTVQRFLRAGQVNQIILTIIPVLIGQGISLFGNLEQDIPLEHVRSVTLGNGLIQVEYQVSTSDE